ncbi:MAG: hypothetical protein IVW51_07660 [Thermaceae bacterium]|nr:hypothetical protein [Thermaceae bacterium]
MFRFYQAALLVVLVAGCGSQTGNVGVDQFIEPGITGHSREVMRKILAMMPESQRQNVIYFDSDGTVYTNRPSLLDGLEKLSRDSSGHWVDAQGQCFDLPVSDGAGANNGVSLSSVQPPAYLFTGTGSYGSVYTTTGFTSISSGIFAPFFGSANTSDGILKTGDLPYVYLGGMSAQSNIDAGVFYETRPGLTASPQYRWSYFINLGNGHPYIIVPKSASSKNQLWLDTSPVYMQFQAVQVI